MSDPRFLVLHGLRLKGFAEAAPVAEASGLSLDAVEGVLRDLAGDELVQYRSGRVSGWSLTPAGRAAHGPLLAAELEAVGARSVVESAYGRFKELNGELLAVCTAWQLREVDGAPVPNDHSDAVYDKGVVERLGAVDDAVQPVTADLGRTLERFGRYPDRLTSALRRVQDGDTDWFTKPLVDSYHTVWFELHEDLLATLGIERS